MGVSTNAELWYGVIFEDGYEFPWDAEPFDGDLEEWWRTQRGFDDSKGYPTKGWLDYQKQFDAEHPCPAETINYCSGEYPMYGLALSGTNHTAYRGTPERIDGLDLSEGEIGRFIEFLGTYQLKHEGEAGWWLTSYWG